jgi:hypothetical protein
MVNYYTRIVDNDKKTGISKPGYLEYLKTA